VIFADLAGFSADLVTVSLRGSGGHGMACPYETEIGF
jgi:hypothetical protein